MKMWYRNEHTVLLVIFVSKERIESSFRQRWKEAYTKIIQPKWPYVPAIGRYGPNWQQNVTYWHGARCFSTWLAKSLHYALIIMTRFFTSSLAFHPSKTGLLCCLDTLPRSGLYTHIINALRPWFLIFLLAKVLIVLHTSISPTITIFSQELHPGYPNLISIMTVNIDCIYPS
jgi:hypothetical protein